MAFNELDLIDQAESSWRSEDMLNSVQKLRGYIQRVTRSIFNHRYKEDNTWHDKRRISRNLINITSLDWSRDTGACEAALDSFEYLYQFPDDDQSKPKVLDFGANKGDFLLLLSGLFPRYDLYGIELQPYAVEVYEEVFNELRNHGPEESIDGFLSNIEANKPKVVTGNFFGNFHEEYSARFGFENIWGTTEDDIEAAVARHGQLSLEEYLEEFPDPYSELDLDIEDFDIIYMYQFSSNTPAVFNFLADKCRTGAKIIVNYRDNDSLDSVFQQYPNIALLERFNNKCAVLEKTNEIV